MQVTMKERCPGCFRSGQRVELKFFRTDVVDGVAYDRWYGHCPDCGRDVRFNFAQNPRYPGCKGARP